MSENHPHDPITEEIDETTVENIDDSTPSAEETGENMEASVPAEDPEAPRDESTGYATALI